MQAWRRVIAALLILVFAPASVLAAVPLQLCLGNDGHHAIKSAFAPDHHLTSHHAGHTHSQCSISRITHRKAPRIASM